MAHFEGSRPIRATYQLALDVLNGRVAYALHAPTLSSRLIVAASREQPDDSWQRGSHRSVAGCVECHLPQKGLKKWIEKAHNGYRHSVANCGCMMWQLAQAPGSVLRYEKPLA